MTDSILDSTKKALGIESDNTAFDVELIMHINSVMSTINQIGVGPAEGFVIEDSTATWTELLDTDVRRNDVKQYVYLRVRIVFDPPGGSFHLVNSMNTLIQELEWRINVRREGDEWVEPVPPQPLDPEVIIVPISEAWVRE